MKNILTLEDESFLSDLIRSILKGYHVVSTATAENAIFKFLEHNRQFSLLISDVRLPISSGVQVALILRSEAPQLKIILISGYPLSMWSEENIAGLQRLGRDTVTILEKPFLPKVLLHSVVALIGTAEPVQQGGV